MPCRTVVPVHYDDYTVQKSPLSDFLDEVRRRGLDDLVQAVGRGETLRLSAAEALSRPETGASG